MTNFKQFIKELDAVCGKFGVSVYLDTTEGEVSISSENPKSLHRILFFPNVDNWPEANEPYVQPDVSEQVEAFMELVHGLVKTSSRQEMFERFGASGSAKLLKSQSDVTFENIRTQLTELLRGVK